MTMNPNILVEIGAALALGNIKGDSLLGKFLGPSVEYLGEGLRNYTQKANENLSRIMGYALCVFDSKGVDEIGVVNPRVLKHVINEGAFCEDEITCAYFGGVLAASRSPDFIDDRGSNLMMLLESLSSYQMRSHYIFYTLLREKYVGENINFGSDWIHQMQVFVPIDEFIRCMYLNLPDSNTKDLILPHIFWGLKRSNLITDFGYGDIYTVRKRYPGANGPGIVIVPSYFGLELYMWINGHSDISAFKFLDNDLQFVNSHLLAMPANTEAFGIEY